MTFVELFADHQAEPAFTWQVERAEMTYGALKPYKVNSLLTAISIRL